MLPATASRRSIYIPRARWRLLKSLPPGDRSSYLAPPRIWAPVRPGSSWVKLPIRGQYCSKRCIHVPPVVYLAPLTFSGLLVALYVWKCVMLVVFQNKIIYMPGFPPNSRSERIADYAGQPCGDITWGEEKTRASDGTELTMVIASVPLPKGTRSTGTTMVESHKPARAHVYVLYLQGQCSHMSAFLTDDGIATDTSI